MLIDVKSISRFCTICVVLGGLVFSSPALSQTDINDGIDPRVIEIVDLIERRISEGNIEFQNQASSAALTRLESIEKIEASVFTDSSEKILASVLEFNRLDSKSQKPSLSRVSEMYTKYADLLASSESVEKQIEVIYPFTVEGNWLEKYYAFRRLSNLRILEGNRQGALQAIEGALSQIPIESSPDLENIELEVYSQYARISAKNELAQLHFLQGNSDLAIKTSLELVNLSQDKQGSRDDLNLIGNLIYTHLISRDSATAIYLGEKLIEFEKSVESDIPGLAYYRVAQAKNANGDFEPALIYANKAISKLEHGRVLRQAQITKAISLAGLGAKEEARRLARSVDVNLDSNYLLVNETGRSPLYLGFLLAQAEDEKLATALYNRRIDVLSRKYLSDNARDTTSMLAALENTRERQEERAEAAQREAELQAITIQKQRTLNRALIGLLAFLLVAVTALLAFMKYREKTLKILAQKEKEAASADKLKSEFLGCLLYTSPSPRDLSTSRMPSSA